MDGPDNMYGVAIYKFGGKPMHRRAAISAARLCLEFRESLLQVEEQCHVAALNIQQQGMAVFHGLFQITQALDGTAVR